MITDFKTPVSENMKFSKMQRLLETDIQLNSIKKLTSHCS